MAILTKTSDSFVARPVKVKTVLLTDNGGGVANISLYDGQFASGDPIVHVHTAIGQSFQALFTDGVPFNQGLFVDADANVDSYVIEYEPI